MLDSFVKNSIKYCTNQLTSALKRNIILLLLIQLSFYACKDDRVDTYGNENTFIKFYGYGGDNIGIKTLSIENKEYIILGTHIAIDRSESNIFLARVDSRGNEIWTDTFNIEKFTEANSMEIDDDGNYIILSSSNLDDLPSSIMESTSTKMHFTRVDAESREITLNKEFKQDRSSLIGSELYKGKNNEYFIVGNNISPSERNIFFIKLSIVDDQLITREYGFASERDNLGEDILGISTTNDVVWIGTANNSSTIKEDINAGRFNELGNIQWNFKFRQDGNQVARKVVDVNDGLVILGNNVAPEGISTFLQKISLDGQIIWINPINSQKTEGKSIAFTKDGGILLTGNIQIESDKQIYL